MGRVLFAQWQKWCRAEVRIGRLWLFLQELAEGAEVGGQGSEFKVRSSGQGQAAFLPEHSQRWCFLVCGVVYVD